MVVLVYFECLGETEENHGSTVKLFMKGMQTGLLLAWCGICVQTASRHKHTSIEVLLFSS